MTRSSDPAAVRALGAYAGAPLADRLHVRVRWRSCPFARLAHLVPLGSRVLDVGCGHGLLPLYLAATGRVGPVSGIDVDEEKLAVARAAAAAAGLTVAFSSEDVADVAGGPWDVITIVDVLYLLGAAAAREVLSAAAERLAPGGQLIVKEIDLRPRWKYELARVQELAATRVLRITQGSEVSFVPPAVLIGELEALGLAVRTERLDRHLPHPHLAIIGQRS